MASQDITLRDNGTNPQDIALTSGENLVRVVDEVQQISEQVNRAMGLVRFSGAFAPWGDISNDTGYDNSVDRYIANRITNLSYLHNGKLIGFTSIISKVGSPTGVIKAHVFTDISASSEAILATAVETYNMADLPSGLQELVFTFATPVTISVDNGIGYELNYTFVSGFTDMIQGRASSTPADGYTQRLKQIGIGSWANGVGPIPGKMIFAEDDFFQEISEQDNRAMGLARLVNEEQHIHESLPFVNGSRRTPYDVWTSGPTFIQRKTISVVSNGDLYFCVVDKTSNELVVGKSTNGGVSWTDQDTANQPNTILNPYYLCTEIDSSGVIHMIYKFGSTAMYHVTFDTSTDTFGTPEDITNGGGIGAEMPPQISIDENDDLHVAWWLSTGIYYQNNIGGSWNTLVTTNPSGTPNLNPNGSMYICEGVPVISISNTDTTIIRAVEVYVGNALNATSFSKHTVIDNNDELVLSTGADVINVNGKTFVMMTAEYYSIARDPWFAYHNDGDSWNTWTKQIAPQRAINEHGHGNFVYRSGRLFAVISIRSTATTGFRAPVIYEFDFTSEKWLRQESLPTIPMYLFYLTTDNSYEDGKLYMGGGFPYGVTSNLDTILFNSFNAEDRKAHRGLVRFNRPHEDIIRNGIDFGATFSLAVSATKHGLVIGDVKNTLVKKVTVSLKYGSVPTSGTFFAKIASGVINGNADGTETTLYQSNETYSYTALTGSYQNFDFTFDMLPVTANDVAIFIEISSWTGQLQFNSSSTSNWTRVIRCSSLAPGIIPWTVSSTNGGFAIDVEFDNPRIDISETSPSARGITKMVDEVLQAVENLLSVRGIVKNVDETENIQEAVNLARGQVRVLNEFVQVIEQVIPSVGIVKNVDEVVEINEAINSARGLVKVLDETVNIIEGVIVSRGLAKIVNENVSILEDQLRILGLSFTVDESVNISEQIIKAQGQIKITDESINIAEAQNSALAKLIIITESINITEQENNALGLTRIIDEVENISEDIVQARGQVRIINEIINIEEDVLAVRGIARTVDETENISETSPFARGQVRIIDEIVNILEGASLARVIVKNVDETVNIQESVIHARGLVRIIDETLNISETVNRSIGQVKIISETVNIQENTLAVGGIVRILDETINIIETVVLARGFSKIVNETEDIQETVNTARGLIKIVNETINIIEQSNLARGFIKIANETENIQEDITKAQGKVRIIDEAVSVLEALLSVRGVVRIVDETENIQEQSNLTQGFIKSVDEAVNIQEDVIHARGIVRQIIESLNISETNPIVRALIAIINESVEIQETADPVRGLVRIVDETEDIQEQLTVYQFLARFIIEFGTKIVRQIGWSGSEQKVGEYGFYSRIRKALDFVSRRDSRR